MARHSDSPHVQSRMALSRGFIEALWPSGEHDYLASHARSFLTGALGDDVPKPRHSGDHVSSAREKLAELLERIAWGLRDENIADEEPF